MRMLVCGWLAIGLVLLGSSSYAVVPTEDQRNCESDNDCVVWDGACCGCEVAGARQQHGVNKKFVSLLSAQLRKQCYGGGCSAGFSSINAVLCQSLKARCLKALCQLK